MKNNQMKPIVTAVLCFFLSTTLFCSPTLALAETTGATVNSGKAGHKSEEVSVTLVSNGHGLSFNNLQAKKGSNFQLPRNSDPNYAFTGWYRDKKLTDKIPDSEASGTPKNAPTIKVDRPLTLWAGWTRKDYLIKLDPNEKGSLKNSIIAGKFGQAVALPIPQDLDPTDCDVFRTWLRYGGDLADPHFIIHDRNELDQDQSVNLQAQWIGKAVSINLNTAKDRLQGTSSRVINAQCGDVFSPFVIDHDENYVLSGWTYASGASVKFPLTATRDLTLTPVWGYRLIDVDYKLNGHGGKDYSREVRAGRPALLKELTDPDFIFEGWYTKPNFEEDSRVLEDGYYPNVQEPITFYAKWSPKVIEVRFLDPQKGNSLDPIVLQNGKKLELPTLSEANQGNRFLGWTIKGDSSSSIYPGGASYQPNSNVTFVAVWSNSVPQISFNVGDHGAKQIAPIDVVAGKDITLPTPTATDGATFIGWFSDPGLTKPVSSPVRATAPMKLYAKWSGGSEEPLSSLSSDDSGSAATILPVVAVIVAIIAAIASTPQGRALLPALPRL